MFSWWWSGRPGVLQLMGSKRVGHDWATDLIWSDLPGPSTHFIIHHSLLSFLFIPCPEMTHPEVKVGRAMGVNHGTLKREVCLVWCESYLGTLFCALLCVSSCSRALAPLWQILIEPLMWAGYQLRALLLNLGGRWERRESEAQSDSLIRSLLLLSQITVKIIVLLLPCYSIFGKLFHLSGPCLLICKLGGWLGHLLANEESLCF